ncbi:MAG: hypothetical protein HY074_00480 [Deltaproteobacteria bacterium]|nr:hypothetical protein [Deltaproteobacteria bacterium]
MRFERRSEYAAAMFALGLWGGLQAELRAAEATHAKVSPVVIAVRYLDFRDPKTGKAISDAESVNTMVNEVSEVWAQCQVGFRLEAYDAIDPRQYGTGFSPVSFAELDHLREATENKRYLTMIGTGAWNRSGNLGHSGSNCYSSFPRDAADGIVCEAKVAKNPILHAHEAGHWLNLKHTNDPASDGVADTTAQNSEHDLMNHFVAPGNRLLTPGQCQRAREAITEWRQNTSIR